MRRMIPNKLINWIKSLVDKLVVDGDKIQDVEANNVFADEELEIGEDGELGTNLENKIQQLGGGVKLYRHHIVWNSSDFELEFISTSSTDYTNTLLSWENCGKFAVGQFSWQGVVIGGSNAWDFHFRYGGLYYTTYDNTGSGIFIHPSNIGWSDLLIATDTVSEL